MLAAGQDALVARHFERDASAASDEGALLERARAGFRVADAEHAAAKDAANEAFVQALERHGIFPRRDATEEAAAGANIFFLDHWAEENAERTEEATGCLLLPPCRTATALLAASADPRRLHSANKDLGVVTWLQGRGVNAFHGDWRQAPFGEEGPFAWPGGGFGGIYLDACGGSAGALLEHLEVWMARAAPRCVLAWTLVERDFGGESMLRRVLRLVSFLQAKGWTPAATTLELATLCHRSGGGGQQIVTQLWVRGDKES